MILINEEIFQLKSIKLFVIEDLVNIILGIIIMVFPIFVKFTGVFYAIFIPIALIYFFKGLLIVIDLVKKDYVCEDLELFRLYPRKFDWLISKNYHELEFLLKSGQKMALKITFEIDIKLRSRVRVYYLKKSKILYGICLI